MTRVAVGVHVHAEPERFRRTLAAIARNTAPTCEVLIIPDGADEATAAELATLRDVRVLDDRGARGGATALNRLVHETDAQIVVLLESGAVPATLWLDGLLDALGSSPRAALAGPTTNRSWNEQGLASRVIESTDAEIEQIANEQRRRHGRSVRLLAPLYSLGDFCYAVRRDVFTAVGDADEGYGLGPCWEMDFNVRAARAGFDGLWARGAYVWRAPFTARRAAAEVELLDASRRRYQNSFCGARLRGETTDYRRHCRGDACGNFAPRRERITPGLPPPPLVSCILEAKGDPGSLARSVRGWLIQDHENLELIVAGEDGASRLGMLARDLRIRSLVVSSSESAAERRRRAIEHARGEIIAVWDEDTAYAPSRIREQAAILAGGASACGSSIVYAWATAEEQAFRRSDTALDPRTLMFRRDAERSDTARDLRNPELWVVRGAEGEPISGDERARVKALLSERAPQFPAAPLVTCIMPTYNRRPFVPLALECFRLQSYPNRELIIVDDGSDPVEDLACREPGVRYIPLTRRMSVGAKRNLACREARGEIIAHWDDDDWYGPSRLDLQVLPILRGEADITGMENRFVLSVADQRFWTVDRRVHRTMFVGDLHGGTILFRTSMWKGGVRYPDSSLGEDAYLLRQALRRGMRMQRIDNDGTFVYVRHGTNTWRFVAGSFIDPSGWHETAAPATFTPHHLAAYREAFTLMAR